MDKQTLTDELKEHAKAIGFSLVGVCPAVEPRGLHRFFDWLDSGYAGEMHYLETRRAAYADPGMVMEGVKSIVILAMDYKTETPAPLESTGFGRIARYAWGEEDYHDTIHTKLKNFKAFVKTLSPSVNVRGVVDTAPLLEREFAQLSGLGWVGKNTMIINRERGSWFFLAALLLDEELVYDKPYEDEYCGNCTACLDACPTDAFVEPYVLDATKCLSYLTIEKRKELSASSKVNFDEWLFGCDICQEVCPWNRKAPSTNESAFQPKLESNPVELLPLFSLDDEGFRNRFRKTPLWRAKRRGILRNAAIILGNQKSKEALPVLQKAMNDSEELIRETCRWAIKQIENA